MPATSMLYMDAQGNGNYKTIQDAVNNARSGDTIVVHPEAYTENVNVVVENLSILSYSGNPEDTIVKHLGSGHNLEKRKGRSTSEAQGAGAQFRWVRIQKCRIIKS